MGFVDPETGEPRVNLNADRPRIPSPGWFGSMHQLLYVLSILGGDQDEQGRYLVRGTIATFMGDPSPDADVAVGSDAQYRKGGQWAGLASAMNATSYGVRNIVVIDGSTEDDA